MPVTATEALILSLHDGLGANLAPGTAIICAAGPDGLPVAQQGRVTVWYEGNVIDAENLKSFVERARCAAGRMVQDYPTMARLSVPVASIEILADFDLVRGIFTRIRDEVGLEQQSGERPDHIIAPETPGGGTRDAAEIAEAAGLPGGRMLSTMPYIWQVSDGRVIVNMEGRDLVMYGPDDHRLDAMLHLLDRHTRRILSGVPAQPPVEDDFSPY